jgi:RNA polymerase sigma factor (sigma-70 family)
MYLNNITLFAGENAETQTIRESTIIQHLGQVHALARRLQYRIPRSVALDDLVGAGAIGLMQALDRFNPSRGLQFATYARHRIWGAMLDFLRGEDPLSRAERREIRAASAHGSSSTIISLEELPAHEPRSARSASCGIADRVDLQRAGNAFRRESSR